jgi:hypothetical protein
MKAASIAASVLVTACIIAACSSTPSRPPIDTTGSVNPGSGGATGATPSDDAGATGTDGGGTTAASDDGGTPIEGGAACSSGNCTGCCIASAPTTCFQGTTNSACGLLGSFCLTCTAGFNCVNGGCQ